MSVIDVERLTKDYGSGRGVFDVSFRIDRGEVFGFLGPNGAGKSTTVRHLMGFSRPDGGRTCIFGKESFSHYPEILNRVGYIPGEIALPAGLTGKEFLRMMRDLRGGRSGGGEKRLKYLLELFELDPSGDTKRMSLGVKRKLAIVSAFMHDPEVLILDEPTSGLDPVMQNVFIRFIKEEKARGKTILLSSHIFSEVEATCDRITIIRDGRLISEFSSEELKHSTHKLYEIRFADRGVCEGFLSLCGSSPLYRLLACRREEGGILVATDDRYINEFVRLLSAFPLRDFGHLRGTLQDYFMSYYREDMDFRINL